LANPCIFGHFLQRELAQVSPHLWPIRWEVTGLKGKIGGGMKMK
jgi:hypothetical protein